MSSPPRDLTVSLINHSNPALLNACLRSLFEATHKVSVDVWVVDNATDGTGVAEMQADFPHVHWIFNLQQQGFSANHNQVLAHCRSRYACILNDDMVIHEGALDRLVAFMDENTQYGMAGARLLNANGSIQNCTFRFPTLWTELVGICILPKTLRWLKTTGIHPAQFEDTPAEVDWVLGACIIVRDQALQQIGLLDDVLSPIANTEEVDWCFRTRKAGWQIGFCPDATITHYGGKSTRTAGPDRIRVEMFRTRVAYFRKNYGRLPSAMLRFIYAATLPWNALMLTYALACRRIGRMRYRNTLATLYRIGVVSLIAPYKCSIQR